MAISPYLNNEDKRERSNKILGVGVEGGNPDAFKDCLWSGLNRMNVFFLIILLKWNLILGRHVGEKQTYVKAVSLAPRPSVSDVWFYFPAVRLQVAISHFPSHFKEFITISAEYISDLVSLNQINTFFLLWFKIHFCVRTGIMSTILKVLHWALLSFPTLPV